MQVDARPVMSTSPRKNQLQWTGRTLSVVFSSAGPSLVHLEEHPLSYRFLRMGSCTGDSADFLHNGLTSHSSQSAFMLSGGASLSHFQKDMRRCLSVLSVRRDGISVSRKAVHLSSTDNETGAVDLFISKRAMMCGRDDMGECFGPVVQSQLKDSFRSTEGCGGHLPEYWHVTEMSNCSPYRVLGSCVFASVNGRATISQPDAGLLSKANKQVQR